MTSKPFKIKSDHTATCISRNISKNSPKKDIYPSDLSTRRKGKDKENDHDLAQYDAEVRTPYIFKRSIIDQPIIKERPNSSCIKQDQLNQAIRKHSPHKKVLNSAVKHGKTSNAAFQQDSNIIKEKESVLQKITSVRPESAFTDNQLIKENNLIKSNEPKIDRSDSVKAKREGKRIFKKTNLADMLKQELSTDTPIKIDQKYGNIEISLSAAPFFPAERTKSFNENGLDATKLTTTLDSHRNGPSSVFVSPLERSRSFKKSNIIDSIRSKANGSNPSIKSQNGSSLEASSIESFNFSSCANSDILDRSDSSDDNTRDHKSILEQEQNFLDTSSSNSKTDIVNNDSPASTLENLKISTREKRKVLKDFVTKRKSFCASKAYHHLWLQVFRTLKFSLRLIKKFQICELWGDSIVKIPLKDNGDMSFIMKMYKSEADNNLTKKMTTLLARNTTRTRDAINELDKMLKYRLPSYALFSLEKRMKLCKIMQYESYPEGKLVCKEAQRAENFYFILSGKIEIFLIKENARTRVNVMNSGESVGRIQLVNDIRMASIATLVPTEFLCINKREFASAQSHVISPEELDEQINALCSLSYFASNRSFLENSKGCFEITIYSIGDIIINEGDMIDRFYFIMNGSCRCTKSVPFISKKNFPVKQLFPYDQNKPLGPQEEIIRCVLDFQALETSDHFPGIPPDANRIKEILEVDSERANSMLRGYIGDSKEDGMYLCQYSVIATSRSEIASISKIDYITHATRSMIAENLMQKNLYHVSIKEVQDAFLAQQQWESYKKTQMK